MLNELAVANLGVIDELRLVLEPGMTALTGETGAGKTLIVEAIELLVGGRADSVLVRPGAGEAVVEGRFDLDGEEVVLSRTIPASGRSRSYLNGRMATAATLAEWGSRLVDLHGQHAHQSLLATAAQRDTLDQFAGVDRRPLADARAAVVALEAELATLGGDSGARAREVDLLRFQLDELADAALADPDEDEALAAEEELLADAAAHREAAAAATAAVVDDGGAADATGAALAAITGRAPFESHEARLRSLIAELTDVAGELRTAGESITDDTERLAEVRSRRQRLRELCRKYGTATVAGGSEEPRAGTLADVMAYAAEVDGRLGELERHQERAASLEAEHAVALAALRKAEADLGAQRRAASGRLAQRVETELGRLGLAKARFGVDVGDDPGDDVRFGLAANPGAPLLPLAKVASGGELARTMLAIRLVLTAAPPTLVFDEVDAGIGGTAAQAVGRALAAIGAHHQVLVVTHLAQVAAAADHQVRVTKQQRRASTSATAERLGHDERVLEVSRMLSGAEDSDTARSHASELLERAAAARGR